MMTVINARESAWTITINNATIHSTSLMDEKGWAKLDQASRDTPR